MSEKIIDAMSAKIIDMICPHCGGSNLHALAYTYWNVERQNWEPYGPDDLIDVYCGDCEKSITAGGVTENGQ